MRKPLWVKLGLMMLATREQATTYLVTALIGAVLVFVATLVLMPIVLKTTLLQALETGAGLGGLLALMALWYWLSIRWMDRHNQW